MWILCQEGWAQTFWGGFFGEAGMIIVQVYSNPVVRSYLVTEGGKE